MSSSDLGELMKIFGIGFWLTLIGSVILPFLGQPSAAVTASAPLTPDESQSTSQTVVQPVLQLRGFDFGEWLKENKKKATYWSIGILAVLTSLIILSKTIWSVEHKAQKLIEAGLFEQARSILDNEIQKKPDNENLYFLYGKYYLAINDFSSATKSFEQAARINSGIRSKISDAYFDEAEKSIKANDSERANNFFSLCIQYDTNKKEDAVKILIQSVEENLKNNNLNAAYSLAQTSINFDANTSKTISDKAFTIAESLTGTSQNATKIIALGEFSNSYTNSQQNEWASLLKSFIGNNSKSIDKFTLAIFCQRAAQWNVSLKKEMSDIALQQAKEEINKAECDASIIESLLNSAVAINNELKPEVSALVWNKLSSSLSDLKALGQSRFLSLFNLCESYGTSSEIQNSDNYQLAFALKNFETGDRERAISIFKNLSENKSSIAGRISSDILSSPRTCTLNFNLEKRKIWDHFEHLIINLSSADIESSVITLTFVVENINPNNSVYFIYAPKLYDHGWPYEPTQPLQIQDDNGKIFNSTTGFLGGRQKEFNDYINKVEFNPNEKATLKVKFPLVSEGACVIKFMSPNYNGWQGPWDWNNIKLKNGPFESNR